MAISATAFSLFCKNISTIISSKFTISPYYEVEVLHKTRGLGETKAKEVVGQDPMMMYYSLCKYHQKLQWLVKGKNNLSFA